MNVAMKILARLGGLQNEQSTDGGTASAAGTEPATVATHGVGADFNPVVQSQTTTQPVAQSVVEPSSGQQQEAGVAPEGEATNEEAGKPAEGSNEGTGEVADEGTEQDTSTSGYVYNGYQMEVTNSPEMVSLFDENKEKLGEVTLDSVNKELFSESGLTPETKQKLYDTFGKASVDMYLEGWRSRNDAEIAKHEQRVADFNRKADSIAETATGGKFEEVMKWANDNLSPEKYKQYQDKINGDDLFVSELALKQLTAESGVLSTGEKGDATSPRTLAVDGGNTSAQQAPQMLSEAEYRKLFEPDPVTKKAPYWGDPNKYDAMRQAGQKAGI